MDKENVAYTLLFSCLVMTYSLGPHGLKHTHHPCSSLFTGVCSTHVHWVSDAIQPSYLMSSLSPPALNLPSISVFSNESALHFRWPKYWSHCIHIPYHRILFHQRKEENPATCYNLDKTCRYSANKTLTKGWILHNSTSMRFLKKSNS